MHVLIVGEQGVGKSTLIRRVLEEVANPIVGFETKKESAADSLLGEPVYIHEVGKPQVQRADNLVGYCGNKVRQRFPFAFDALAPKLLEMESENCIILLDELGTLESGAEEFCGAILSLLDGNTPVIAAVKHKDTPFLQAVRGHKNAKCFYLTPNNRDELLCEVLNFMKEQI